MDPDLRAVIAYVAGTLILDRPTTSSIRDHARDAQIEMSADIRDAYIAFYDYARSCPVSGSRHRGDVELFDYGLNQGIRFSIEGPTFQGTADGASTFSGEVTGDLVVIFDGEARAGFRYTLA